MRRGVVVAGWLLLIVVMVVGLASCTKAAPTRTPVAQEPAQTQQAESPSGSGATSQPGETVVSAFTQVPQQPVVSAGTAVPEPGTPVVAATPVATSMPAPTSAAQPGQPASGYITHVVQPGETLNSIAARYGTTVQAISQANNITNPNQIYAGQKLKIPTSGSSTGSTTGTPGTTSGCRIRHTVKQGEWVWQIARDYGVSPYEILAANGMTVQTANTIYPGMVLCIP
jgi:LysM repeat protein